MAARKRTEDIEVMIDTATSESVLLTDEIDAKRYKEIATALWTLLDEIDAANNSPVPGNAKVALVYNAAIRASQARKQYAIPGPEGIVWQP